MAAAGQQRVRTAAGGGSRLAAVSAAESAPCSSRSSPAADVPGVPFDFKAAKKGAVQQVDGLMKWWNKFPACQVYVAIRLPDGALVAESRWGGTVWCCCWGFQSAFESNIEPTSSQ